ncbi:hypothetical protein Pr1d_16610 [Bythopirellula goksoeyrii]|uniref:Uncharacterized protein n=1 Tax=Bythopirellula goksoeyrii TaxID=1400387 RepID=A0A5B9Q9U1_9BACT|nr:hypothetical protein Pr1d_16610 [Bythopirellula goksoeyrii]
MTVNEFSDPLIDLSVSADFSDLLLLDQKILIC